MLDRKTKDTDASIELLEDRKKLSWLVFRIFFAIGCMFVLAATIAPYKCEIIFGIGIFVLIFDTWFFCDVNYYNTLIMIKRLNAKDEKNVG